MADLESFSDIRTAVTTALQEIDPDKGADLYVCDLGDDWVVYSDPDAKGAGYYKCSYHLDGDKAVLDGKASKVQRRTTYESVDGGAPPKNLKEAATAAKQVFAERRASKASEKSSYNDNSGEPDKPDPGASGALRPK